MTPLHGAEIGMSITRCRPPSSFVAELCPASVATTSQALVSAFDCRRSTLVDKPSIVDGSTSSTFPQVRPVDNSRRESTSDNRDWRYCRRMLLGYARVSSADQNPDHQVDALRRAGVAAENIHVDHASGAKASRPKLDLVLKLLRDGDELAITRLDRLGRSVLHLIGLGAELREKGVGLKVLEQGIDTATAEGRAMFGMLSVLAELQRELIVANTRDGLAAARARGRKGGRPPKLTTEQVEHAQRLYDEGKHTVAQIAELLGVRRTTLYGHLNKAAAASAGPDTPLPAAGAGEVEHSAPPRRTPRACPSCGHEPTTRAEAAHQRADLAVTWLYRDPDVPGNVVARNHCRSCQPEDPAVDIACTVCGDGPILTGELAGGDDSNEGLPRPVQRWLTDAGWRTNPTLLCPDHT
ncbi:recombinase family protein [Speluncibacter jeojiensis]|uniref:Recombinase family protein n=1 Tax=Speluncibacter jeojiensis TaxID=2710754 RepID=A0A9X4RD22_9ACTN|nr:recombinase family protein [Corynebacteriales bacterium D3-21]